MMSLFQKTIITLISFLLFACGGGSSDSGRNISSSSIGSASSVSSGQLQTAVLTGLVTYDYVPHNANHLGLDYQNIYAKPARGVRVEVVDEFGNLLSSTQTNSEGYFEFSVTQNQLIKIRVVAHLQSSTSPSWSISVNDNTQQNAVYAMDGQLKTVESSNEVRHLHAASGWSGSAYNDVRSAAPFAILDTIYSGVNALQTIGLEKDLPPLVIYWSEKNTTAEGEVALGEIGTSYFSQNAIYLLGDANADTDEYDAHIILHEWTHYLETFISRTDSIGGDNNTLEKFDMRLAFSEGFANAFAGMILNDPIYKDTSGISQSSGFFINLANKSQSIRGWYSQGSITSILYNYYLIGSNNTEKNIQDIFRAINNPNYINNPYFTSIFSFSESLQQQAPDGFLIWSSLLIEQNINSALSSAEDETNSGGYAENLPVYKNLSMENPSAVLCSSNRFGSLNHLSNFQFASLVIENIGQYNLYANNFNQNTIANPDLYFYSSGNLLQQAKSTMANEESMQLFLLPGRYLVVIGDAQIIAGLQGQDVTRCFQLTLSEGL